MSGVSPTATSSRAGERKEPRRDNKDALVTYVRARLGRTKSLPGFTRDQGTARFVQEVRQWLQTLAEPRAVALELAEEIPVHDGNLQNSRWQVFLRTKLKPFERARSGGDSASPVAGSAAASSSDGAAALARRDDVSSPSPEPEDAMLLDDFLGHMGIDTGSTELSRLLQPAIDHLSTRVRESTDGPPHKTQRLEENLSTLRSMGAQDIAEARAEALGGMLDDFSDERHVPHRRFRSLCLDEEDCYRGVALGGQRGSSARRSATAKEDVV